MMPAAPLQAGAPTVGDTIWVARTVAVAPGVTLRPADWTPADPVERLGPPQVTPHGDSVTIAYPVVVWRAGALSVDIPGPVLLGAGGRVDSLGPQAVALDIRSVLPQVPAESLAPQPRADFVPRTTETIAPVLILVAAAAALLAPLHWWWRRRGHPRPRPVLPGPGMSEPPLDRWADVGESRAVAAVAVTRLRAAVAAAMPEAHEGLDTEELLHIVRGRFDWPLAELGDLLRSLDEARFGVTPFPDAVGLARWADELAPRLGRAAA